MTWRQKYNDAVAIIKDLQVQVDAMTATLATKDRQIANLRAHHELHHSQTVGVGVRL